MKTIRTLLSDQIDTIVQAAAGGAIVLVMLLGSFSSV